MSRARAHTPYTRTPSTSTSTPSLLFKYAVVRGGLALSGHPMRIDPTDRAHVSYSNTTMYYAYITSIVQVAPALLNKCSKCTGDKTYVQFPIKYYYHRGLRIKPNNPTTAKIIPTYTAHRALSSTRIGSSGRIPKTRFE